MVDSLAALKKKVLACQLCADLLPLGPRPVVQIHADARILIAGQAPGSRVHKSGVPFDDPSGERLREWLGIDSTTFYDARKIAILPMGFCYPGRGNSGDLPPLQRCSATWRQQLLNALQNVQLTVVIGQYAMRWHLKGHKRNVTDTVRAWADYGGDVFPLPHPSPRNNIWLAKNPWFASDVLPNLQKAVGEVLAD